MEGVAGQPALLPYLLLGKGLVDLIQQRCDTISRGVIAGRPAV